MTQGTGTAGAPSRIRIWDAPVRLFHWAIVALFGVLWWSGEERLFDWHRLAGYTLLALVLFRVIWGLVGSQTARFSSFVRGPGTVAAYVRGSMFRRGAAPHAGHNPLGGWSVILLLALLALQVGLGLFAVDVDGMESGPFSYLVEFDTGRFAAETHELVFNLLLATIALHVVAVAFYLVVRRENLVRPMITGARPWHGVAPALRFASLPLALALLAISGGVVWALIHFLGQ